MANLREVFQPLEDYKEAVKAAANHFPGVCSPTITMMQCNTHCLYVHVHVHVHVYICTVEN